MTDTTDIAALRREVCGISRLFEAEKFIEKLIGLLEAERQRAERGEAAAAIIQQMYNELKGDQVPVAVVELNDNLTVAEIVGDIPRRKAVRELYEGALVIGQELFTAPQKPVALDADMIRDANRYRFLRDEDAWGEDSDSWDAEIRTGLISSENLMGGLSPDHFDDAIDARMAASDIPFLNPAPAPQKPVVHPDTKRMDWLCAHCVEVRDPQMYGSHAMFHAQQDSEEWDLPHHTTLREQVDAAIEAAGGVVKDGE